MTRILITPLDRQVAIPIVSQSEGADDFQRELVTKFNQAALQAVTLSSSQVPHFFDLE
jgi:hypothetical protein